MNDKEGNLPDSERSLKRDHPQQLYTDNVFANDLGNFDHADIWRNL